MFLFVFDILIIFWKPKVAILATMTNPKIGVIIVSKITCSNFVPIPLPQGVFSTSDSILDLPPQRINYTYVNSIISFRCWPFLLHAWDLSVELLYTERRFPSVR